jgi:hypothetical protein
MNSPSVRVKSGYHFEANACEELSMKTSNRFSDEQLRTLSKSRGIRIRAGMGSHRFIGIWFVEVEQRIFVRSWSVKPEGWYRTFLREPRGAIVVGKVEIAVRAVPIRSKRLRDAADEAYLARYNTKGAIKYARDLGSAKSRATTIELVPRESRSPQKKA